MIGIFDSGVGGLSVLKEIIKLNPEISFCYFADNANVPYGEKSADFILERSLKITDFLSNRGAQVLVIACNTATAVAADVIRSNISLPVIAVEPPLKPAVLQSKKLIIGVLATAVTLESERFDKLVKKYATNCKIIKRVSNDLVPLIEKNIITEQQTQQLLRQIVSNLCEQGADSVVLGSTHFYFLSEYIRELSENKLICFSPSEASARQACKIIQQSAGISSSGSAQFFVSGEIKEFNKSLKAIFPDFDFSAQQANI